MSVEKFEFIHSLKWEDLPETTRTQARRCLLDGLGTAIGGRQTDCSRIIHDYVAGVFTGQGALLWQDGREVSPPGAALANGMTIDSLDIHDGFKLNKGHAGAALIPAVLATLSLDRNERISGKELLVTLVMGYEVALRAGLGLHSTACDFHSSGAWNALGCAAITARRLRLGTEETRHALGIAEYHGPRSQIMRAVDFPAMVKDGSGWGAMAGVSAGMLAAQGFTGAPALTVEGAEAARFWSDLGERWRILELYFKPYAVCYWAQPAVRAALRLQQDHHILPEAIRRIRVITFHHATRLACRRPRFTDEAQYSLPFPVAAALVHGKLGARELDGEGLEDPSVLRIADCVELVEDPALSARFPAERCARVSIQTQDGSSYESAETPPPWDETDPPTDEELHTKYRWLAREVLPAEKAIGIEEMAWECEHLEDAKLLVEALR